MMDRLFICTDLDRTLIPNGSQPASPDSLIKFKQLVERPEVTLAYVSGRDRSLIEKAIKTYALPVPDFVIADVGTSIYRIADKGEWQRLMAWDVAIAEDWAGKTNEDIKSMLAVITELRLQEYKKQAMHKVSFYVPQQIDQKELEKKIEDRFASVGIKASLIWSIDEPNQIGLLDILPESATKYHAIDVLMEQNGFELDVTVFSGDSGNDLEVLVSPVPSVLVANAMDEVKKTARELVHKNGQIENYYEARGDFMGMNGNYSAGILEGIAHYHPETIDWMSST